jgi:hypothetical protein
MTIFYPGPEVRITHEVFVILGPCPRRLKINELEDVHIIRGDLHPARVTTAHTAGGAIVLVSVSWPFLDSAAVWLVALAALAASIGISGACARLAPRTYELRATYRGLAVRLYASSDLTRFGQVKRALVRAIEAGATET